ncbi:Ku protein [Streptomyces sp. HNM0575]|uniref:non-homologous end joining protein Ku n=1 Tax=Streptomyces sp. HNM0575 TaxID=2716338 RepID=UPI00145EF0A0|nr:Ku protein [Streptomyces sp. HNM0575]NLU71356.1 Ku protein [Streptomyces sp. HNM0575]
MARPIWSGVITFGLVTVPVQLFAAVEDHAIHFHQLQRGTGDRVRNRRVSERTGKRVEYDDIVKGYDVGGGEYVVVEREELEEIAPGRSQVIEVGGFVDLDEVEPAYFSRTYYLAPRSDEYARVYRLLFTALDESGRAGIATFVMHAREYLVALRAGDEALELHTLHWADEVRDPERELPRLPGRESGRSEELHSARQLIDAMAMDWRPEEYEDTYETKVRQLVEAKRDGKEVVAEEKPPEATNVVDLEDALRRSVDQAGSRRGEARRPRKRNGGRGPGGRGGGGDGGRRLSELSKRDLYELATEHDVQGRSRMNRQQLVRALSDGRPRKAAS